jgi:hypothetical protein
VRDMQITSDKTRRLRTSILQHHLLGRHRKPLTALLGNSGDRRSISKAHIWAGSGQQSIMEMVNGRVLGFTFSVNDATYRLNYYNFYRASTNRTLNNLALATATY